ncbi:MAG: UvrD-helicase domain-containing protein [Pirellulaceae bacterium]
MSRQLNKPHLSIAGPGAGKTHSMVDDIAKVLGSLPAHQHLAAITYTNAAAHTIRERLQKVVQLRSNVFIGTTHAFVSRFILTPCATLFGALPEERLFAAIDVHSKGKGAAVYTKNLVKKGIVPFDAMFPAARKLLKNEIVRKRLGQRLAFLFIDEFQDTDIGMLEIIEQLRKSGGTRVSAVGDPEQFVMTFTYRGVKAPAFEKLPFFRFQELAESRPLLENHRSNGEIVTFSNRFRDDLKQKPIKPFRDTARVQFLVGCDLRDLVIRFQQQSKDIEVEGATRARLYLSEENATFDPVMEEFGIKVTSNLGRKSATLLGDALELIATALDRSPRKARIDLNLSRLQWRAAGTHVLMRSLRDDYRVEEFVAFVKERFNHKVSASRQELVADDLAQLKAHAAMCEVEEPFERCASIRRAKGLEADAVLAVALRLSELKKWLTTDRDERNADRQDKCRLGYVAFTRPRELLCIACLKPADDAIYEILVELGVHMVRTDSAEVL